jgi:hypothetical protein
MTGCIQYGNGEYDLRFGDAFYDGSWLEGFNLEDALSKVQCPTVLMHTAPGYKGSYYAGKVVLLAPMDGKDARLAHPLLFSDVFLDNIHSGHDIHDEKPEEFLKVMEMLEAHPRREKAGWPQVNGCSRFAQERKRRM